MSNRQILFVTGLFVGLTYFIILNLIKMWLVLERGWVYK